MDSSYHSRRAKRQRTDVDELHSEQNTALFREPNMIQSQGSAANFPMYHNIDSSWMQNNLPGVGMNYHPHSTSVPLTGYLEPILSSPWNYTHPAPDTEQPSYRMNLPDTGHTTYFQPQLTLQPGIGLCSMNEETISQHLYHQLQYGLGGANSTLDAPNSTANQAIELVCFGMVSSGKREI